MEASHKAKIPIAVAAIDSVMGRHFEPNRVVRDLHKAYVGIRACVRYAPRTLRHMSYMFLQRRAACVVDRALGLRGFWCGETATSHMFSSYRASGGDKILKCLQQLCVAHVTGATLLYSTFKGTAVRDLGHCVTKTTRSGNV